MDNPDTQATLCTRHGTKANKENKQITPKILMISNTTLQYKTGVNKGDRECKQFLILKMKPVVARTYSQVR